MDIDLQNKDEVVSFVKNAMDAMAMQQLDNQKRQYASDFLKANEDENITTDQE